MSNQSIIPDPSGQMHLTLLYPLLERTGFAYIASAESNVILSNQGKTLLEAGILYPVYLINPISNVLLVKAEDEMLYWLPSILFKKIVPVHSADSESNSSKYPEKNEEKSDL